MARWTINIGSGTAIVGGGADFRIAASDTGAITPALVLGGGPAYLHRIIFRSNSWCEVRIKYYQDGSFADAGQRLPDLINKWESFSRAIVLRIGSREFAYAGPSSNLNPNTDATEPYSWQAPQSPSALIDAWRGASAAERAAATLTFQDNEQQPANVGEITARAVLASPSVIDRAMPVQVNADAALGAPVALPPPVRPGVLAAEAVLGVPAGVGGSDPVRARWTTGNVQATLLYDDDDLIGISLDDNSHAGSQIDRRLVDTVAGVAYLRRFRVWGGAAPDNFTSAYLGLSSSPGVRFGSGGPDLIPAWENFDAAITVTVGGRSYDLAGPNAAGTTHSDNSEPYNWADGDTARHGAIVAAVAANPDAVVSVSLQTLHTARPESLVAQARAVAPLAIGRAIPRSLSADAALGAPVALPPPARPGVLAAEAVLPAPSAIDRAIPRPLSADAALGAPVALPPPVRSGVLAAEAVLGQPAIIPPHRQSIDVAIRATRPRNRVVTCIEINHPDSPSGPVRAVNDTQDLVVGGETYMATHFKAQMASDVERQAPQAQIVIGNIGRDLSDWIEVIGGGAGGTVSIFELLIRDDGPAGDREWEIEMDIQNIACADLVTVQLGFNPLLGRPAVGLRFDPQTSPGLF